MDHALLPPLCATMSEVARAASAAAKGRLRHTICSFAAPAAANAHLGFGLRDELVAPTRQFQNWLKTSKESFKSVVLASFLFLYLVLN